MTCSSNSALLLGGEKYSRTVFKMEKRELSMKSEERINRSRVAGEMVNSQLHASASGYQEKCVLWYILLWWNKSNHLIWMLSCFGFVWIPYLHGHNVYPTVTHWLDLCPSSRVCWLVFKGSFFNLCSSIFLVHLISLFFTCHAESLCLF